MLTALDEPPQSKPLGTPSAPEKQTDNATHAAFSQKRGTPKSRIYHEEHEDQSKEKGSTEGWLENALWDENVGWSNARHEKGAARGGAHSPQSRLYDSENWQRHGNDYLAVVRKYGNRITHLHIKEHLSRQGELVSQPPAGMGDIEWGKVFAFLYEHDYDGPLSIEPHGPIWSKGDKREKMLLLTQRHIRQFLGDA